MAFSSFRGSFHPRSVGALVATLLLAAFLGVSSANADETLIPFGSTWRYLDNGSNQGTAWSDTSFVDTSWAQGNAELGYGDGGEATVVGFGPNSSAKYITTYFRRSFQVTDPGAFAALSLGVVRDDGAVVYLNGVEVWRSNLPAGTIGYQTLASVAIGGADESALHQVSISPSALAAGTNVIAVEIHQANGTSTDISFNLQLTGTSSASVVRGPYLQNGTASAVTVRWRTNAPTDSRVRYGTVAGSLTANADDANVSTEHEVRLSGLDTDTKYYYAVGSTAGDLAGGDASTFFVTSPATGSSRPTRIWVLGDSGTADANATAVRNAYESFTGANHTHAVLMLGDNAYNNGTDSEYQAAVFNMYPAMLRKSVLWPTIGNHDTAGSTAPPSSLPYYAIFTLPTGGEAGGLPSGTEDYYAFDYGGIHFVCLDSMTSDRSPGGPMMTWLASDLASTDQPWIIAFWHHPPYTKGSHDSDTEGQLAEMRQNALPILENGGVDLVLTGHSHSYERSYLIDGHYGQSSTFTSGMKIDGGSGRESETGAYDKSSGPSPHEGAVYAVAGSSGKISGGLLNHPAMFISLNNLGSMVLDFDGNRLDARFLRENGSTVDSFTIIKGAVPPTPPAAPSNLVAGATTPTAVSLTWNDNAGDELGFRVERCTGTDCTNFVQITETAANTAAFNDTTATAGTLHRYRVYAYNGAGPSPFSNVAEATTPQEPPPPPSAPSSLTAVAQSATQINLAWTDMSSNESGFRVERCAGNNCSNFVEIAQIGAGATAFNSTGLTKNTFYRFRVRAFNATGNSAYSNIATARTLKK